jgi:chitodextrinase
VTGVKGYVYEPLLRACAHPDILFDRYTDGYNLAESYYMASNFLGWMDVVVGDPKIIPYADKLPDLNISIEGLHYSPNIPNEREEISITSTIHNIGNRTVNNLVVSFYLVTDQDEIEIDTQTIISLAPDEYSKLSVEYTPDVTGAAKLRVVIDPANFLKEFFENNNAAEKDVYINNDPTNHGLTLVNNHIYRTEEFKFTSRCSDIETSQSQLVPLLETKYETNEEYFTFENGQISYLYNTLISSWEIKVTSNTSMALGLYSFRISYTDPNNAVSNYYFVPFGLRVLNNKPTMDRVTFNRTEINRTEEVKILFNASDIENSHNGLQIEAQYRLKPADETSEAGWRDIEMIFYDNDKLYWWCKIEFDREAGLGQYQARAFVTDLDEDQSAWMYTDRNFSVLNNQPYITNVSLDKFSIYRTQTVQLSVMGYDIEDFRVLSGLTCEIEYGVPVNTKFNDIIWDYQYIATIDYDLDNAAWVTEFTPLEGSRLVNYNFRARIQDNDGYWSTWWQAPEYVRVLNNWPTANLGTIPESTMEDDEVTFNAKGSSDIEDDEAELLYYWEVINSDLDELITEDNNQIFKYKFTYPGDYQISLKVTDLDGAYDWKNSSIKVENVKPMAKIFVDHKTAVVNQKITFNAEGTTDTESDIRSLKYRWDFGDNNVVTGMIVQHSFRDPDTYDVTLSVTDDNGDTNSATISIRVEPVSPESEGGEEGANAFEKYVLPLGIIVIIVIIILVVVVLYHRRKQAKEEKEEKQKALQAAMPVDHTLIKDTLGVKMPMFPGPPPMALYPGAPGAFPPQFPPQTQTQATFGHPGTPGTPITDTPSLPGTVPTSMQETSPGEEVTTIGQPPEQLATIDEKPALPPPEPTGPVMLDSLPLEVIETEEHPDLESTYDKPELMDITLPKEGTPESKDNTTEQVDEKSDENKESN